MEFKPRLSDPKTHPFFIFIYSFPLPPPAIWWGVWGGEGEEKRQHRPKGGDRVRKQAQARYERPLRLGQIEAKGLRVAGRDQTS